MGFSPNIFLTISERKKSCICWGGQWCASDLLQSIGYCSDSRKSTYTCNLGKLNFIWVSQFGSGVQFLACTTGVDNKKTFLLSASISNLYFLVDLECSLTLLPRALEVFSDVGWVTPICLTFPMVNYVLSLPLRMPGRSWNAWRMPGRCP